MELKQSIGKTAKDVLDYTGYNSMYCGKNGEKGNYNWWLASPSCNDGAAVCEVDSENASLSANYDDLGEDYAPGLSPLVCLKSDFQIEIAN